jgi:hypothetical protein
MQSDANLVRPHSSDQTQPLDLGVFGIQKAAMGRVIPPEWLSRQSRQIAKIIGSYDAVTAPPNVISAFAQMVITLYCSPKRQALTANGIEGLPGS